MKCALQKLGATLLVLLLLPGGIRCLQFEAVDTDITEAPGILALLALVQSTNASQQIRRAKFVYISYRNDNNIRGFAFDYDTGGLTEVAGSPFPTGADPIGICLHPNNRFLYVADYNSMSITGYAADPDTGALTPLAGSPYATGTNPWDCAIHPNGNFLYVTLLGTLNNMPLYNIDTNTGALTAGTAQTTSANTSQSILLNADGSRMFASHSGATALSSMTVNLTTGAVGQVPGSPYAAGNFTRQLALSSDELFLYVPSRGDSNTRIYANTSGTLAEIAGSPVAGGGQVMASAISPDGNYFYTGEQTSNVLRGYSRNTTTGAITALGPTHAAAFPQTLFFEPGGTYLFALSSAAAGNTAVFRYNSSDGTLTEVAASPHGFGDSPYQAVFVTETVSQ